MPVTPEQLENLQQIGWKDMTVADLMGQLAGLPPMMEVFINADGTSMFLNEIGVEDSQEVDGVTIPPILRITASTTPAPPKAPDTRSIEEQTAAKAQKAMDLSAIADEASRMPRIVPE